jgi:hypothetical protein
MIHPKLGSNKIWHARKYSAYVVVEKGLSPSMAAWPGSVIEDDLVRKSFGRQRMQAAVPARHGMAAGRQPRQLGDASIASCLAAFAPIHPAGQVTLSQVER